MVGAERFEVSKPRTVTSDNHKDNKGNQMKDTQNNAALVADLKHRLAEAEASRRELLVGAFFYYSKDTSEIIRLLITKASPEVVTKLEELLTEGGGVMASPKLRKPPFALFRGMFSALPPDQQVYMLASIYDALPYVRGIDIVVELRRRIIALPSPPLAAVPADSAPVSEGKG